MWCATGSEFDCVSVWSFVVSPKCSLRVCVYFRTRSFPNTTTKQLQTKRCLEICDAIYDIFHTMYASYSVQANLACTIDFWNWNLSVSSSILKFFFLKRIKQNNAFHIVDRRFIFDLFTFFNEKNSRFIFMWFCSQFPFSLFLLHPFICRTLMFESIWPLTVRTSVSA